MTPNPSKQEIAVIICQGKVRHDSRKLAITSLREHERLNDYRRHDRETMLVYCCNVCKGFHIGHLDVISARAARRRVNETKEEKAMAEIREFEAE